MEGEGTGGGKVWENTGACNVNSSKFAYFLFSLFFLRMLYLNYLF